MSKDDLSGKIVLLTGAAGGIGRETARCLARGGARLVLLDRDEEPLRRLATEIGQPDAWCLCDVSRQAEVVAAHEAARRRHGRIDAAILNAGTESSYAPLGEVDPAEFDRVFAVNVHGVLHGLNDLMPAMKAQGGGAIVLVASSGGLRGVVGLSPYVASKHAVIGLMRCAAREGAAAGIRVVAVAPGATETRMIEAIDHARSPSGAASAKAAATSAIPLQRYGRPEEIARLITFLVGDGASYCTGAVYQADGGLLA